MRGNATVVHVGNATVSIPASAALTGLLLASIQSAAKGSSEITPPSVSAPGSAQHPVTLPAPPGSGINSLVVPDGDDGVISVPAGYRFVTYQGHGTVTGGDASTAVIVGSNYTGGAGTVIGSGTQAGTVTDTTPGAQFGMAGGDELVLGRADSQGYRFDSGSSTLVSTGHDEALSVGSAASVVGYFAGTASVVQTGGAQTVVADPGSSTTMVATAGDSLIFDSDAGDVVTLGSGNAFVANAFGLSTITAGSGADTVLANGSAPGMGGVIYRGGTGRSLFIGGAGTSTVYAAAQETAFGGRGGEVVSVTGGSNLLFLGGGGADTITGNASVAPTVWGHDGEHLGVENAAKGGVYILFGNNDQMDLSSTGGGAHILGLDAAPFAGNATLTMSNAGNDSLVLFSADEFQMAHANATITVLNWQASDVLDLTFGMAGGQAAGYSTSDVAKAQAALAAGNSFTLPDGTTVVFQGAKPTTVAHI